MILLRSNYVIFLIKHDPFSKIEYAFSTLYRLSKWLQKKINPYDKLHQEEQWVIYTQGW